MQIAKTGPKNQIVVLLTDLQLGEYWNFLYMLDQVHIYGIQEIRLQLGLLRLFTS